MEKGSVVAVLESLANGIDPGSGQRIEAQCYQNADVVRALFAATELLKQPQNERQRNSRFPAQGSAWTAEEDAQLTGEHAAHMSTAQIALKHGRSSGAITSRLIKLGLVSPPRPQRG